MWLILSAPLHPTWQRGKIPLLDRSAEGAGEDAHEEKVCLWYFC